MTTLQPVIRLVPEGADVPATKRAAREAVAESARLAGLPLEAPHELRKNDADAPLPSLGTHWSLSHSGGFVAGLSSTSPVGIDLERVRLPLERSRAKIARALLDEDELALLGLRSHEDLDPRTWVRVWTAKEATLKAVGLGLLGLSGCKLEEILEDGRVRTCSHGNRPFAVETLEAPEFTISVATLTPRPLKWHGLPQAPPVPAHP